MKSKHFEVQFLYNRGDLLKVLENFDDWFFMGASESYYIKYPFIETAFHWKKTPQGDRYWSFIFRELSKVNPYAR